MKTRTWAWCGVYLLSVVSTVSICSAAGNPADKQPGPNAGPPTGTAHWKVLSPAPPNCQGCMLPQSRGFHGPTIVYNPGSNEVILFGGRDSAKNNLNDVWVLTNANGQNNDVSDCPPTCWTNTIANGSPGSPSIRSGHSAVYDVANDRMIVFGGCNGDCEPPLKDVWVLTNASTPNPMWMQLSAAPPSPGARTKAVAAYDPNNNLMIIFGGQNGGGRGGEYSDTWVLSNANGLGGTPVWTKLNPAGTPAAGQYGATGTYDSSNNILTVFGGETASGGLTNGLWTLSNANGRGGTPTWNQITISGDQPSPRAFHTAVYNPRYNSMTIFGGNNATEFNDLWVLNNANGVGGSSSWTQIGSGSVGSFAGPSVRASHAAAYDTANDLMMIFGGNVGGGYDGWFVAPWVLTDASGQSHPDYR